MTINNKTMLTYEELNENILKWADDRGLLVKGNAPKQYLKILEEIGETARAILKNDEQGMKDGFGDIAVTILIYSKQLGVRQGFEDEPDIDFLGFSGLLTIIGNKIFLDLAMCVLIGLARSYNLDLLECLNIAWNEIKDRTGQTKDGIFVKD